jgi:hypothetical protein
LALLDALTELMTTPQLTWEQTEAWLPLAAHISSHMTQNVICVRILGVSRRLALKIERIVSSMSLMVYSKVWNVYP